MPHRRLTEPVEHGGQPGHVAQLAEDGRALPKRLARHRAVLRPGGDEGAEHLGARPHVLARPRRGQRRRRPATALRQIPADGPEEVERTAEPEEGLALGRPLGAPGEGRPQVVVLAPRGGRATPPAGPRSRCRLRLLGQRQEVGGVPPPGRVGLSALLQALQGVLADRLQHGQPAAPRPAAHVPLHEALVEQPPQALQDVAARRPAPPAWRPRRRRPPRPPPACSPPAKTARRRNSARSARGEQVVAPGDGRPAASAAGPARRARRR